jgi:hypothetical protein
LLLSLPQVPRWSPVQARSPKARIFNPSRTPQCTANAGDLLQFHTPESPGLNLSNLSLRAVASLFGPSDRHGHLPLWHCLTTQLTQRYVTD